MRGKYYRNEPSRPKLKLTRGADGRLRSAGDGDIGDIWAEQKRIRLAEAIQQDQKKAEKAKRRGEPKEVVVKIGLPRIKVPKMPKVRIRRPKVSKRVFFAGSTLVVALVLGFVGYGFLNGKEEDKKITSAGVLDASDEQPEFDTILPAGKSIEALGGWARVSPPDKDPAFAYVDTLEGVQLNVTQQPLPETLKRDTDNELRKLAERFGSRHKVETDVVTVYVGTSAKGPQSAVLIREDLLILIKSSSALTDKQWTGYVTALE